VQIPAAGAYAFKSDGPRAELWIAGQHVKLDGSAPVTLPAGPAPLRLYVKNTEGQPAANPRLILRWQAPGAAAFAELPAAAFSHTAADEARTKLYADWIPLVNPTTPIYNRRQFEVTLPRAGFWELVGPRGDWVRVWQVWMDGHPLYYRQGRGIPETRLGLFSEERAIRYLPAGKHVITLYTPGGDPWYWDDTMDKDLPNWTLGMAQLTAGSPEAGLTVTPLRDDLVLRRGEALTWRLEQITGKPLGYRVDLRRQREGDAPIWSQRVVLPANAHALADVSYPCPEEGAYEWLVKDDRGNVVDGPWAFVVVDPTPLPILRWAAKTARERRAH